MSTRVLTWPHTKNLTHAPQLMGVMAGCFISFGGLLAVSVGGSIPGVAAASPGLAKLLVGLVFPYGWVGGYGWVGLGRMACLHCGPLLCLCPCAPAHAAQPPFSQADDHAGVRR